MTLLGSVFTHFLAFQASDRLLTQRVAYTDGRSTVREFDVYSNKTVIYYGHRCILSFSYTGRAFLNRMPADRWITEQISGRDLSQRAALTLGTVDTLLDAGQAIERLRAALESAFAAMKPKRTENAFQIQVAGSDFRRRDRRIRPIVAVIGNLVSAPSTFVVERVQRSWRWDKDNFLMFHGAESSEAHRYARTRTRAGFLSSPERARELLVETIRHIADSSPYVGHACIVVTISLGGSPLVAIHFDAHHPALARFGAARVPLAFTPWIVARDGVVHPSLSVGNALFNTATMDNRLSSNVVLPPDSPVLAFFQSQPRPVEP